MKQDATFEAMEMMFKISRLLKDEMSYTNNIVHLSMLQIQTLIFLKQHVNASMTDIAAYFRIELPSATSLINILCDQKLVNRSENKSDRRLVMIALTEEGKTLMEEALRGRRKKIERLLSYLSVEQKSDLLNILKTITAKLQK